MSSSRIPTVVHITALFASLACPAFLAAADWPQFRGPNASGVAADAVLPTKWDVEQGTNIRWQTVIPGMAHASPIVHGDRVYVATAVSPEKPELKVGLYGDIGSANDRGAVQWRLLALDKSDGTMIWNVLGHEAVPRVKRHTKASHCNSTPATDGDRIVAIFGSEGLFCFGRDGKLIWKKDLGPMDSGYFLSPTAQWGFASSPVIHDGKVVVQCDVQKESFIALFDLADGREIWRSARTDVPTWSTPTIAQVGGKAVILVNGWRHTGAYDFGTGKEIWKLDGGGDIPVPAPILSDGLAYFTSAHGRYRPMRAIRLESASGDITPPDISEASGAIAWVHARQGNYMQTPILVGNLLFGCTDSGVLTCFDAKTGKIHYTERLVKGGEGFTASPVSDGRHLFFPSELGKVVVVPVAPAFSIVATNETGQTVMASPAIADQILLLRTAEKLVAIGGPAKP